MPRTALVLASLALALGASVVLAVMYGAVALPASAILAALGGSGDDATRLIVTEIRLPRVLAAAVVGAALAAAGALLQGLLRNPLADPYVTGSSAGGAVGAVGAVVLGLAGAWVPALAFAGAFAASVLVWQLARIGGRTTVLTVLLAGVVLSSFAAAAVTILLVASDRIGVRLRAVFDVLVGSVTTRHWSEVQAALLVVMAGIILALVVAPRLDAYAFGEEQAAALGVDTQRTTFLTLAAAALLSGSAVALAGLVGFVGLVVPHAVRALVGAAHRRVIAASALLGAVTLVLADAGARVAFAPTEIPVGAVTGLVGGPFFLALLYRSRVMRV